MKSCTLEGLEHVRAEVEGHEFREAEGDGDVVLQGVEQGLEVLPLRLLGVDGESGRLQGFEVPVQGPRVAFDLACQVRRRFSLS